VARRALFTWPLLAALVAHAGPLAGAPAPKQPAQAAPAGLEGQWSLESLTRGGKPFRAPPGSMIMEFQDKTLTIVVWQGGKDVTSTAPLALDAANKQFAASQHRTADGQLAHPDMNYGYAIDGDRLTLATTQLPNLAFVAADPLNPGTMDVVIVLTRVKK
jgi:uncharacterized protein (TIGR03067 family)